MNTKKIENALKELFKDTNLENYQYDGFDNADDLIESLRTQISEDEVIYYSNAMKYLIENDISLNESIGIAVELGYSLENINSELLATLLQQKNLNDELENLIPEINDIFNE